MKNAQYSLKHLILLLGIAAIPFALMSEYNRRMNSRDAAIARIELKTGKPFLYRDGLTYVYGLELEGQRLSAELISDIRLLNDAGSIELSSAEFCDDDLRCLTGFWAANCLNLSQTETTDKGVEIISVLQTLDTLLLADTAITDNSVASLARLKNLTTLNVTQTELTPNGLRQIKKMLPNCKVYHD